METKIKPYDKNAKKHPDRQLKQIANSLRDFGWQQPIVVDKDGVIIVGHGRWLAYQKFPEGIAEPRIEVADLTEEQAKAYRLADNKLNESEWDMGLVIEELKGLSPEMFDLTGFDKDLLIEPDEKDDEVPENVPSKTKLGDLYELGQHRVLCGDSTQPEAVLRLMDGKKADMVFTDPPYNVNYSGSGKNTSEVILNDKMSTEEFSTFLVEAFKRLTEIVKGGGGCYVFHSHKTASDFEKALNIVGFHIDTQLIWNKPSAGMGMNDYRTKHEPFYYCYLSKDDKVFYGDRTGNTIWKIPQDDNKAFKWFKRQQESLEKGNSTVWSMSRANVNDYVHPTQKPVELASTAIIKSSKVGDIVLDTFLGSGTTMISAEKTNRICYGMELDPKYCDVIVQRYVDYTGNENIKLNGEDIIWKKTVIKPK